MKATLAKLDRAMPYTGPMLASACVANFEEPEDTGLGFMEFFDWLASCKDAELVKLGFDLEVAFMPASVNPLTSAQRHDLGMRIWEKM